MEFWHGRDNQEIEPSRNNFKAITDRVNKAQEGEHLEEIEEKTLLVFSGLHGQQHVNEDDP